MKTILVSLVAVLFSLSVFSQSISDYIFTVTSGTYTELTGATVTSASGDDGTHASLPVGFTFNYCGTNYTTFNVTTNGCVYLGTSIGYTNDIASTTYKPLIAPLWDDLYDDSYSDVSYKTEGSSPNRVLTVQWKNMLWGRYSTETALPTYRQNFQVKIYETTGVIELVYGNMQVPGTERAPTASIGMNNNPGGTGYYLSVTPGVSPTVSSTVANNNVNSISNLTNGLIYRFTPSSCTSPSGLTAANITQTQADLSWTSAGTLFNLQYGNAGFILGTGTSLTGLTSTTYQVTGLNPSSEYQFYVQNDCGAEQSNWTGPYTFYTLCDAITATYIQNFDGATVPALPNCWNKIVIGASGTPTITTVTTAPYSSPNCVQMFNATSVGSSTHLLLISPQFSDLASGGKQVRFRAKMTGTGTFAMHVGTMSSSTNQNSFTAMQTYYDLTTTWQEYIISFDSYAGTDQFIAIKHGLGTTSQYLYIDNFTWELIPTCPWPTALQASGIQDIQANFNWTEMGTATEWQIEYGSTAHTPGTGTKVIANSNPYTVTGLTEQTTYDFYVRAICGPGDTSAWTGPVSVTTTCSLVSNFFENFDAVTAPAFPPCWYKVGTTGSTYTYTTNPSSSPNCVYIYSSSTTNKAVAAMTPVNNAGANTHQIRFKARATGTTGGILEVGYLTNPSDAATFVNIQSYTMTSAVYQEYICYPGTSVGANTTFAFRHTGSPTYSILIDDVYWEPKPTCPPPFNLTAANVTAYTADLGWTSSGTETQWNIEYGISGFTLGGGIQLTGVTNNPYSLTGLNPASVYQFYVQADCGGGDISSWAGPFTFTTLCAPITSFPWTEGFESVTTPAFPPCWLEENGDWVTTYNSLSTYDADARTGTQFLRETYSATNEFMWTPGFQVVAGQSYDFSFWWAGDDLAGWAGDVFVNTSQSSTGAIQIGGSFVTSTITTTKTYKEEIYTVTPTSSGTYYFAIRINCTSSPWYISFDDFRFELTPTCPRPSAQTAANITQNSANLSWVAGGSETAWDIQYGISGFTLGTGTIINDVTNPYILTGLNPSSTYQYYVLAQCSPTDSSTWEGPYSFTTLCGPTTATYIQNFDGTTIPNMPNCWNKIVIGASGTPTITTVTTTPYSTPNCVQMYNATSVGSSTHLLLVSPQFSDMATGLNQVRFQAKMTGTGTPVMHVGTMSDPLNQTTFTILQTFMDLTTNWQEYVISFASYSGSNQFIAIKHGLGTTEQRIFIDNFTWEPIPTCPWPTAFQATSIEDVQVTFAWTEMGTATEWQIEYGPTGHAPGTGTIVTGVNSNPYTVTGLTATTVYQFYVRAVCGAGDTSSWTGPLSVTTACTPISVYPWTEGFESVTIPAYPSCWFEENGDWVTTNNSNTTYDADAHSGIQFLRDTYSATNEYMWTPGFYMTAGESYDLKFWWAGDNYAGWAGEIFVNTLQSSTGASQLGAPFVTATVTTDKVYRQEIRTFAPTSTGIYYFAIRINCTSSPWYISFDDFFLAPTPAHDLAVTQILNPATGCNLTATEDVIISVTNFGTQTVTDPDFEYKINSGTVISETFSGTIDPLETITYTFTTQADFSAPATPFSVKAWSVFATDPLAYNDTATINFTTISSISSLIEDFTAFSNGHVTPFPNGWTASPATGYRWEVISGQTPTTLTGPSGDHTTGTGKYLFTESTNGVTNAVASFTSTCLDLSSFTLPRLTFWYHFYGTDVNKMYVEVLSNGLWLKVDSIVGQQQTAMTSPWLRRAITLSQPNIALIRFTGIRGVGGYGDIAIDDIMIEESPAVDLKVISWQAPIYTGCGTAGVDQISVNVQNAGTNPITNAGIAYQVNGGAIELDTIYSTLQPGDIITFTYQQAYDFTAAGSYVVKTFINESTDTDPANDTLARVITVTPFVTTYPYIDTFEGAASYWTTGGTNNTWQHGVPAGTNINSAYSGTKAWVTNLTGYYNNSEASWVEGPCFDFSAIVNPILTIRINVNSENSYDGGQVQYSINGGTTWITLGAYNDFYNWYNDNSISGLAWTTVQEGWTGYATTGWQLAGHSLQPLIGQSDVRFRVVFGSETSVNSYDGFAFDDFTITQTGDLASIPATGNLSGCNINADTIRMYIKNVGPVTIASGESMNVKYIVNILPAVSELLTLSSNLVPGDSILYTFNQLYSFAPGTYTVKTIVDYATDMVSSNDTSQYTVNLQTIAVQIMGGDTIHLNPAYLPYTLSLINLGYTYTTYYWSNFDGSVTGSNASFNAPALGWYYVTVTNASCVASDSIYLDDLVSISFNNTQYGIQVFPNPATNVVNINAAFRTSENISVQIISSEGKIIETRLYDNSSIINDYLDVTKYVRGLYFIRIMYNNSTYIDKINLE